MTKDEYTARRKEIDNERVERMHKLDIDYAMQFKQADIGDVITCEDNDRVIRVDYIGYVKDSRFNPPDIVYRGEQLAKRTLKPYKKSTRTSICGSFFGKVLVKGECNE